MVTFLLEGEWKAEDDQSTGSADKSKLTSRKYVGFTSIFLLTKSVLSMLCVKRRSLRLRSQENCEDGRQHVKT